MFLVYYIYIIITIIIIIHIYIYIILVYSWENHGTLSPSPELYDGFSSKSCLKQITRG